MSNEITRRANTINATMQVNTEFGCILTGRVTISNQVRAPEGYWTDVVDADRDTSTELEPVGFLSSTWTDVDGTKRLIDLDTVIDPLNELLDKLEKTSPKKPTKQGVVVNKETGKTQNHWYLSADDMATLVMPDLTYRIRPMLYQDTGATDREQKLLISIVKSFVPATKASFRIKRPS